MIILRHVGTILHDKAELDALLAQLNVSTANIDDIKFVDIFFPQEKSEYVLMLECTDEAKYLAWKDTVPAPEGVSDWHEVMMKKETLFSG